MRVGSLVFDTSQGLGILAKSFYDHGVVTDVLVVHHGKRPSNLDWYPGAPRVTDLNDDVQRGRIYDFCFHMDVLLFFETPFLWNILGLMRETRKKTVIMSMYECMPKVLPAEPDLILCPSLLDLSYYPQGKYLPVPVEVPWRQRTRAEVFVHNAGHGGLKGRNGTNEVVEAFDKYINSPAKLLLRAQDSKVVSLDVFCNPRNTSCQFGTVRRESLYKTGDVFVFPEKFNGLSLPLQEARASGMLVMATDRFPNNMYLPRELDRGPVDTDMEDRWVNPLIPVKNYRINNVSPRCNDFEEAVVDPKDIAAKIDELYGTDITDYSLSGREWARTMSWDSLRPKYLQLLEDLCKSN